MALTPDPSPAGAGEGDPHVQSPPPPLPLPLAREREILTAPSPSPPAAQVFPSARQRRDPFSGWPITRHHSQMTARRLKHWIASWFIGAVALLFLIEEWLWNGLKQAMAVLGRLPGLRHLERWI